MEQQTQGTERPTFSLKLYLEHNGYQKEAVIAGLERAAETVRKFGLIESDRIRDSGGMALGSYRIHRLNQSSQG